MVNEAYQALMLTNVVHKANIVIHADVRMHRW